MKGKFSKKICKSEYSPYVLDSWRNVHRWPVTISLGKIPQTKTWTPSWRESQKNFSSAAHCNDMRRKASEPMSNFLADLSRIITFLFACIHCILSHDFKHHILPCKTCLSEIVKHVVSKIFWFLEYFKFTAVLLS